MSGLLGWVSISIPWPWLRLLLLPWWPLLHAIQQGYFPRIQLRFFKGIELDSCLYNDVKDELQKRKKRNPQQGSGSSRLLCVSWGCVLTSAIAKPSSPLRFGQALALRGTSLSAQPVSVY